MRTSPLTTTAFYTRDRAFAPGREPGLVRDEAAAERVRAERHRVSAQVAALRAEFDAIVAASEFTAADDEHDPDGATIGFERAQASALLDRAQRRLDALDRALARLDAGTYGRCERCGDAIGPERLAALPDTTRCVPCATRG